MTMTVQTERRNIVSENGATASLVGTNEPLPFAFLQSLVASGVALDKVASRLIELGQLEEGWFDGEGQALDPEGLAWFNSCMHHFYLGRGLPDLALHASVLGGVSAELSLERFECALEVDLSTHQATWLDVDIRSDADGVERTLNLDDASEWRWIVERIESLTNRVRDMAVDRGWQYGPVNIGARRP